MPAPLAAQAGGRLVVRGLDFAGNRAIDDLTLGVSIATSPSTWIARQWLTRWTGLGEDRYFDETEFRRDVLRLLLLYRRSGFIDARVDTVVQRSDDAVTVRFVITEGEPIRVTSLTVEGTAAIVPPRELIRDLPMQVGDPFDRAQLIASGDSLRAEMRDRGYPFAEVYRNFAVQNAAHTAQVEYVVDPGPAAWVDRVDVIGPPDLDEALVREVMRVKPGDRFSESELVRSQQDLYRLDVFDFVDVRLADTLPRVDSTVTVEVQVSRGRLHRIRTGAGWGTVDCFRTLSTWTIRNFLGGGRSLDLSAGFSKIGTGSPFAAGFERNLCQGLSPEADAGGERLKLNYNLGATVRFPTLFSPSRDASISVTGERFSEFQAYIRDAVGVNVAVTQQTPFDVPLTVSYAVSVGRTVADDAVFCSIFNVCRADDAERFKERRRKATLGLLAIRDRTNSPINPTRGMVLSLDGRVAAEFTGSDPDIEFAKGIAELSSYHRVGRTGVFAWRVRWGSIRSPDFTLARPDVRFIPTEERFYAGGPTSVRGFRQNELGPLVHVEEVDSVFVGLDTLIVRDTLVSPTGGSNMVFGNAEYRFPLSGSGRIGGVVFVDAGQVFAEGDTSRRTSGIRVTPGVGVRFFTPIGPIRFDIAYNPHGPEEGPLFRRYCTTREGQGRVCSPEALPVAEFFTRDIGNGIFGLGNTIGFFRDLRFNFSIGQAF